MTTRKRTSTSGGGPRTRAGKARSSLNALRHGLRARHVVLPGESRPLFRRLLRQFVAAYQPAGTHQHLLVEQMAVAYWKLYRISRLESLVYGARSRDDRLGALAYRFLLGQFEKGKNRPAPQPAAEPGQTRSTPDEVLARAILNDTAGDRTLAQLSHYEMRLERSLHRAFRSLLRLQSASAAPSAPPR